MIKLSKENQAKLEKKRQEEKKLADTKDAEEEPQNHQQSDGRGSDQTKTNNNTLLDVNSWDKAEAGTVFNLVDFFPIPENEIRKFSNGKSNKYLYLTHKDSEAFQAQSVMIQDKKQHIQVWEWDESVIKVTNQPDALLSFIFNKDLHQSNQQQVWLKDPIQLDNQWKDNEQVTKITGVFSRANIDSQSYDNVIEISQGKSKRYLAQNIGLIAEVDQDTVWVLKHRNQQVKLISPVRILQPDTHQKTVLTQSDTEMEWQTNGSLARSFTKLFQAQKWIGKDIQVNDVIIEDDYVHIDFSPGVVATLNAHPSGEQAVLAAMIANVCQWTQRDKVKITVNSYIMTPATLTFPPNGIYENNPEWQKSFMEQPLSTM